MVTIAPPLIELTDFSGGWRPDDESSGVPLNGLLDVLNLIVDPTSGAVVTRKGFKRVVNCTEGYTVASMRVYTRLSGMSNSGSWLIVVVTNGSPNTANNVILYSVDLSTYTAARISPVGKTFPTATGLHWGEPIQGVYYGGGDGAKMYSWSPGGGWTDDASVPNWPVLVDSRSPTGGQVAYDKAFKEGDKVLYNSVAYAATEGFEFRRWHANISYSKGDIVIRKSTFNDGEDTGDEYRRAYKAKKDHKAKAENRPGDGTSTTKWPKCWKPIALSLPIDADGERTEDWDLIPLAATTPIGLWHGERLWLRWDDSTDKGLARLQYSAPAKPEKGADIADLQWDPRDFRVDTGKKGGEGGGWEPVAEGDGDPITCLLSFGYYLLIFKRRQSFILAGLNRNTWTKRELAEVGCVGPKAATVHDGLAYFLSDEGLYYTDGTQCMPVPGSEVFNAWLRATMLHSNELTNCVLWSYGPFLWVGIETASHANDCVVAYHPASRSLWKTDLEASAVAVAKVSGKDCMFFAKPTDTRALVYMYDHPDVQAAPTDDVGGATYASTPITWLMRTAWMAFGGVREERRIRRIFVLVKGASGASANLKAYRNYSATAEWTKAIAPTSAAARYFEGKLTSDSFSLSLAVDGAGAPCAILAVAAETQPRRVRYHS